jgi:hypothetical protein
MHVNSILSSSLNRPALPTKLLFDSQQKLSKSKQPCLQKSRISNQVIPHQKSLIIAIVQRLISYTGHQPPVQDQQPPGLQSELKGPEPQSENIPNEDGGYEIYRAAGKLKDKSCIITGGDSGIGRATAILFAMEGADSLIAYLPEEESDAQETKKKVEEQGRKCHLLALDLTKKENCKKVVETALKEMGKIDILFNNAAYQMMVDDIQDLSEYVDSSPHYYPILTPGQ